MKISIENAQRKVSFKVSSNSNFSLFEVGTHQMENKKIVENIEAAVEQLKEKWPGGWKNILRLYLKPMRQSKVSIPIYYSKINPNDIEVPVETGVKQTRLDKIGEQLAKKSKKLRIDHKTKKVVKVKGEAPPKGKQVKDQKKKDKKRKIESGEAAVKVEGAEVEATETPAEAEPKNKKKKKNSVSEPAVVVKEESAEPKNKKKKKASESEVVVAAPEGKKKKSIPEPTPAPTDKKADKKKKNIAAVEAAPAVEVAAEAPKKKKNKKSKV
jgi:hypothetical protein